MRPACVFVILVAATACDEPEPERVVEVGTDSDEAPDEPLPQTAREQDAAHQLARGVPHLASADLVMWHRLRLALANRDERLCARLFRGNASDVDLIRALDGIPSADSAEYLAIVNRAHALAREQSRLPQSDDDALLVGFAAIMASLPTDDGSRFGAAVQSDPSQVANEDACFAYRTLVGEALELDEPARTGFFRALVTDAARTVLGE